MSVEEEEYQEAKVSYIAAHDRLRRAKANRPANGPGKANLAREAGFRRDDAVMARYHQDIKCVATLASEFGISPSCVRSILKKYVGSFVDIHAEWRKEVEDRIAALK